jgi:hypothetical protein
MSAVGPKLGPKPEQTGQYRTEQERMNQPAKRLKYRTIPNKKARDTTAPCVFQDRCLLGPFDDIAKRGPLWTLARCARHINGT